MTHEKLALLSIALLCAVAPRLSAQTPWIHIEVEEMGDEDNHVKVNVPLAIVEIAAEAAPEKILSKGQLDLALYEDGIEVEDLRRMWQAVRDTADSDLLSIEGSNETVRIRREGDRVLLDVNDSESSGNVRIRVPVTVVDALLSGESEKLDVRAALEELRKSEAGEIVTVDDQDTRVRIWIDERD